jgi:outer membrane lipoprotein SlyB
LITLATRQLTKNASGGTQMNSAFHPRRLLVVAAIAGSALGGIVVGSTALAPLMASAATSIPSTPAAATSPGTGSTSAPPMPAHGTAAHENAEVPVTGANAAQAQAAAVKAVGGGTAGAVTTDYSKTGYEVTVTRSDGTSTEVHLDSSFNVIPRP